MEYNKLELLKKDKHIGKAVGLTLFPDGSQLEITINGTTLNVTKTSLDAIIGNFNIGISCRNISNILPPQHSSQAPNVLVVSVSQSNPLHVISGDPPHVTASHTLSKLIS